MKQLLAFLLVLSLWASSAAPAQAASDTHLVLCESSAAFQERMHSAPQNYYFEEPYQLYAANLLCGEDGLPHLQLRFDRALDIVIPFGIFFYFAGFVGWSGRAYLIGGKQASKPEETEIFIDIS
ncbi:MAG: Photosystem I reaction center subunit III, partial [Cyanobacteria bacterium J06628_4]